MNFVRATPADAPEISEVVNAAYSKWVPIIGREPLPMTVNYERAAIDHIIDKLIVGSEVVGIIEIAPEAGCLLVVNVAVKPTETGKGYGAALMAHAVDVARALSLPRCRLYTHRLMSENIVLYQKLGYKIDGQETTSDGRKIVHMSIAI